MQTSLSSSTGGIACISGKAFQFGNKTSVLFPRSKQQVHNYFHSLTNTVGTTLSLSQNRSLTGYWWARLRVASNDTIHANAASADIGLPGLSCQKNISFIVFAVTGHALIAWWRGLKSLICKYKEIRLFNFQWVTSLRAPYQRVHSWRTQWNCYTLPHYFRRTHASSVLIWDEDLMIYSSTMLI